MPIESASDPAFGNLSREFARVMERMARDRLSALRPESWTPAVNLYETESAYIVCVDLAGVDKKKIDLTVVNGQLNIEGSRQAPNCPKKLDDESAGAMRAKVHLMEIDHGSFSRQVELPDDVVQEKINAAYRNGLLWIELPKKN